MFRLEIFFIFSTLAATGQSLTCKRCYLLDSVTCTGFNEVCQPGYVCASRLTISFIGSSIYQVFQRFCAPQAECNVTGTFTDEIGKNKIATTCCNTDSCTPTAPKLPDSSSQPNGVWCQQCISWDKSSCTGGLVKCTGEESKCFMESSKESTGSQTVYSSKRGCASIGYCNKMNTTSDTGVVQKENTITCTNGVPNYIATVTVRNAVPTTCLLLLFGFSTIYL
ncbi:uncharacterized protein [Pyxicephalus adspersus]|uniref:uncharacterized protein n=1 Tax=Pyxicephalus adspersus TaxID=30357 RepID=UPI003B5913BE